MPRWPDRLKTGVYLIRNRVNGKVYVGSAAQSLTERWTTHRKSLRRGTHYNEYLQRAWDRYGERAFEFVVLIRCQSGDCVRVEQAFIDRLDATNEEKGYNQCKIAGGTLGFKWTEESKAKMSATRKRQCASQEYREMVGERFSKPKTLEHREKLRAANLGKKNGPLSAETKAKIGSKLKGRKFTLETRMKMAASARNRRR